MTQTDPERAAIIDALLPQIPFDGWTTKALRQALASLGQEPEDAKLLFPNGGGEMIEAFCTLADERMAEAASQAGFGALRTPDRVKAIIALRFSQNRGNKEAVRRALSWMALPPNTALAAKLTARTVDAIWHAAGDASADVSWYTKRGILAAIYGATVLYWLRDTSEDDAETLVFLDRRLADLGKVTNLRREIEGRLSGLKDRLRNLNPRRA